MNFSDFFSVYRSERKSDFPRSGTRARSYALLVPGHRKSDLSRFSSRAGCAVCLGLSEKFVYRSERKSDFPRSVTRARSYALLEPCHRKSDFFGFSSRTGFSICLYLSVAVCLPLSLCLSPPPSCVGALGDTRYRPQGSSSQTASQPADQPASQPTSQPAAAASQPASHPAIQQQPAASQRSSQPSSNNSSQ